MLILRWREKEKENDVGKNDKDKERRRLIERQKGEKIEWSEGEGEKREGNWNVGGSREKENEIKMVPYADGELQSDR